MKLLLLLAACSSIPKTTGPQRNVRLVIVGDSQRDIYVKAASIWSVLGFTIGYQDAGRVECQRKWFDDKQTCQYTIGIIRDPTLRQRAGTNAESNRDQRAVRIDSAVVDQYQLMIAVAHEVGHILLDTERHTQGGVMGGSDWALGEVDRQLACETVKVCK